MTAVVCGSGWKRLADGAVVFDAMGRRVTQAEPGVYFLVEAQTQAQAQAGQKPQASSHKLQAVREAVLVE